MKHFLPGMTLYVVNQMCLGIIYHNIRVYITLKEISMCVCVVGGVLGKGASGS